MGQSTTLDNGNTDTTSEDYYARSGDMLEATSTDSVPSSVTDSFSVTTGAVSTSSIATQQSPLVEKEEV